MGQRPPAANHARGRKNVEARLAVAKRQVPDCDNGGPFRSFRFEASIATHPSYGTCAPASKHPDRTAHVSAGSAPRSREALLKEIPNTLDMVAHAEDDRIEYNTVRPPEALAWNRPRDIHLGLANPLTPSSRDRRSASCLTRDNHHPAAGVQISRPGTRVPGRR
jgi:hypothetical protein